MAQTQKVITTFDTLSEATKVTEKIQAGRPDFTMIEQACAAWLLKIFCASEQVYAEVEDCLPE